jgi:hypothetical protein
MGLSTVSRKNVVQPSSTTVELRFDLTAVFHTGQDVPESGVYRVTHWGHRLPHEVTLLGNEQFPHCAKCADMVVFELLALTSSVREKHSGIILYELPEIDSDEQDAQAL